MIKETKEKILDILEKLPANYKVLDVGGAAAPFKRANSIIDLIPYEEINWQQAKGSGEVKFNKNSYIQHDICAREKWPIEDKSFDYSICSHVLEDIRDPLWVCSEIIRVSKAGYIEIPSKLYEMSFGVESRKLSGAAHHRWVIDLFENKLRFTFKYFYIHHKLVNKNKRKPNLKNENMYLRLEWSDSFEYYENWLNSGKKIFEYYLDKPITEKKKWQLYRKTGNKNILLSWLSYLKHTNKYANKIFNIIKKNTHD